MSTETNKIKTSLHLDRHKRKIDGKSQFKLRVYVGNKKYLYIRTNKYMDRKYWVDKQIKSGKSNPEASNLKAELSNLVSRCEKAVNELIENKKTTTLKALENALFSPAPQSTKYKTYLDFIEVCQRIDIEKDKIREAAIRRERTCIKRLTDWDNETPLQDIDSEWLEKLEIHMIQNKGYSVSTRANVFNLLRKTIFKALAKKLITYDPFHGFKFQRAETGNRQFLTLAELEHLHELFTSGYFLNEGKKRKSSARHHVLQIFLTSCYTGLRHGDVIRLNRSWFYGDMIRATLNKSRGKKTISIPVTRRLNEILAEDGEDVYYRKAFSLNYTDEILKEITKLAGIKKHITFHCSRHTFACVGLELGITTEVIQAVLGHSNIRETQIYARIQARSVKDAMKAWDDIPSAVTPKPTKLQKVS